MYLVSSRKGLVVARERGSMKFEAGVDIFDICFGAMSAAVMRCRKYIWQYDAIAAATKQGVAWSSRVILYTKEHAAEILLIV